MQRRRETLVSLKLCRFCLSEDDTLSSIYEERTSDNVPQLQLKILSALSIQVFPSDKSLTYICNRCKYYIEICHQYKQVCQNADTIVLNYIQKKKPLKAVTWPEMLCKYAEEETKSIKPKRKLLHTVVEGGATVEVTSQDVSDSEDDDGEVFNIKIGDGSNENYKTECIQVVTNNDQLQITKQKSAGQKGFGSMTKLKKHLKGHAGDRLFPCKFCSKTFMMSHHYTRHLRLKHRDSDQPSHGAGPIAETETYPCDQCSETFHTQDDLIYHSAIHATQSLTCPLCQEKFQDVDAVTAHIKSHVSGVEFMCDLCELVFTSKEKLDNHVGIAHEEELRQEQEMALDESSMEMDDEEDDDSINVKEENGEMIVEVKKPGNFMYKKTEVAEINKNSMEGTLENSESEADPLYTEMSNSEMVTIVRNVPKTNKASAETVKSAAAVISASVLQRSDEAKRKVVRTPRDDITVRKETKAPDIGTGASDKSLRLLEKELQDLKRTNSRAELVKTTKTAEITKRMRLPVQASTPKPRTIEEKKFMLNSKPVSVERKPPERRAVKENKEPKEVREPKSNNNSIKEDKEIKTVMKNASNEKNVADESGVRRSTRPSKVKDYAKMIRDQNEDEEEDSDGDKDEEYKEANKSTDVIKRGRRSAVKTVPKPVAAVVTPATPVRKRGRPRRGPNKHEVPSKIRKENEEDDSEDEGELEKEPDMKKENEEVQKQVPENKDNEEVKEESANKAISNNTVKSPSGQCLKKIPMGALPPGIKPLPLPQRPALNKKAEVCEMQIGQKVVKVQKIVMTKAEVESMAKKGLVEMKDGTMVLKPGIKLPTNDAHAIKSTLIGNGERKNVIPKPTPSRFDMGEDESVN